MALTQFFQQLRRRHGMMSLAADPTVLAVAAAGSPTKVIGFVGTHLDGFTFAGDALTNVDGGGEFSFNGVCDFQVDKACNTVHELYLNGNPTGMKTPHTFVSPAKTGTIAITKIATLSPGDVLEVYVTTDTANTTFTFHNLDVTFHMG